MEFFSPLSNVLIQHTSVCCKILRMSNNISRQMSKVTEAFLQAAQRLGQPLVVVVGKTFGLKRELLLSWFLGDSLFVLVGYPTYLEF